MLKLLQSFFFIAREVNVVFETLRVFSDIVKSQKRFLKLSLLKMYIALLIFSTK